MMNDNSMRAANDWVFQHVEGWVGHRVIQILEFIKEYHEEHNVVGDICEIGVHHGKLFFVMAHLARPKEKCIAVDIFERQDLNVDQSGKGSLEQFTRHLKEGFPNLISQVKTIAWDSMSMTPSSVRSVLETSGVRVFSVDGGHTVAHVVNDLCLAQEVLVPGGVVLLDDFFGLAWPGVTEGYFKYMDSSNRRLLPFLSFQNKLFLTTFSEKNSVGESFRTYINPVVGDEIHLEWKYTNISGTKVLCYHGQ